MAKISQGLIKKFSKDLTRVIEAKLTSPSAKSAISRKLRPLIERNVNVAIAGKGGRGDTVAASAFQPLKRPNPEDLIGRLGVAKLGQEGQPDYNRLKFAWVQLLPRKGNNIAKLSLSFSGKRSLGRATYTVDEEKFYTSRLSTFAYFRHTGENRESGRREFTIIEWMRHFINGVIIPGYGFAGPTSPAFLRSPGRSRTDLGLLIKIPSGNFTIRPLPFDPFEILTNAIRRRFNSREFREELKKQIVSAIR